MRDSIVLISFPRLVYAQKQILNTLNSEYQGGDRGNSNNSGTDDFDKK